MKITTTGQKTSHRFEYGYSRFLANQDKKGTVFTLPWSTCSPLKTIILFSLSTKIKHKNTEMKKREE